MFAAGKRCDKRRSPEQPYSVSAVCGFCKKPIQRGITRIFPSGLRDALIVITKTDIQIVSLGKPPKTGESPLLAAQGRGCGLPQWILTIHVMARRLTVFAAIMSNEVGNHLIPRSPLPISHKLMSANIANIVSLNSCHSGIIRNE